MSQISSPAQNVIEQLDRMNQEGELSYRIEGMCLVIVAVKELFSKNDQKAITEAIINAFKRFNQNVSDNRFAQEVIKHLNS